MMAGFRKQEEIRSYLETFSSFPNEAKDVFSSLLRSFSSKEGNSLSSFFSALFNLSKDEKEKLTNFIINTNENEVSSNCNNVSSNQWELMKKFASLYPGDPAVISPLYLNLLTLSPGQAVFIPAGVLHAYLKGFGVELMSSSDNVLRGGLTPKHVDIGELMNILDFSPFMPQIIEPPSSFDLFKYPCPCEDFSLVFMRGKGGKTELKEKGASICIVTEGSLRADVENGSDKDIIFTKGESFFIPNREKDESIFFSGNYCAFIAAKGGSL
jgi:mannose-6-phosphate isomerase